VSQLVSEPPGSIMEVSKQRSGQRTIFSLNGMRAMNDLGTEIHLHARVFRAGCEWYADLDDQGDPQPDDPYWYGYYESQRAAIEAACARLAAFNLARATRISEQLLLTATSLA
jgi:hypothetical protein